MRSREQVRGGIQDMIKLLLEQLTNESSRRVRGRNMTPGSFSSSIRFTIPGSSGCGTITNLQRMSSKHLYSLILSTIFQNNQSNRLLKKNEESRYMEQMLLQVLQWIVNKIQTLMSSSSSRPGTSASCCDTWDSRRADSSWACPGCAVWS